MERHTPSIRPAEEPSLKPIAIDNSNSDKILARPYIIK